MADKTIYIRKGILYCSKHKVPLKKGSGKPVEWFCPVAACYIGVI